MKACLVLLALCALVARPTAAVDCNYLVQAGDNLFDLAEANGTNETELLRLNPSITNKELILEGSVLKLPCEDGDADGGPNLYTLLARRSDLSTLFAALASVGMLEDLKDGSFDATVFAPTDKAFADLLAQLDLTAGQLLNDTALVSDVLSYHIIPGRKLYSGGLRNGRSYRTLLPGKRLTIKKADGKVEVETVAGQSVPVIQADLTAGDAVVHVIDSVLLPLEAEGPTAAPTTPTTETPTTPAAPAPKPAQVPCVYTVVEGDTLFNISTKYGLTLDAVLALNKNVEDPDLIQPGDKIVLRRCG